MSYLVSRHTYILDMFYKRLKKSYRDCKTRYNEKKNDFKSKIVKAVKLRQYIIFKRFLSIKCFNYFCNKVLH